MVTELKLPSLGLNARVHMGEEIRRYRFLHRGLYILLRLLGVNRGLNAKTFDHVRQTTGEPRVSSTFPRVVQPPRVKATEE